MAAQAAAKKAPLGLRVVGAAAATGALGFGAYYGSQLGVVAALEREREDLETKVHAVCAAGTRVGACHSLARTAREACWPPAAPATLV